MNKKIFLLIGMFVVALSGLGMWFASSSNGNGTVQFRKVAVDRGNLLATISATGTCVPEEVVDVGARVNGQIVEFGPDPNDSRKRIDFCSRVKSGDILAKVDAAPYELQVEQATQTLGEAEANVQRAKADLIQLHAKVHQTERDWRRVQTLGKGNAVSGLEYDTAQALYETSRSLHSVGEAVLAQAKKSAARAQAALKEAQTNLGYTTITSPVDGIIIARRVNVGQTVVSSLASPSLFLIAKDLRRMQVWASVNEADIGQIHERQPVSFTVDAHPNETMQGEVYQVRLNATMTQNVVTYTVVVNTDNVSGRLLPYMTANLQFEIRERPDVLRVSGAALRWRPQMHLILPQERAAYAQSLRRKSADNARSAADKERHDRGILWIEQDGFVRPLPVRVGLSDGTVTEVSGDGVSEGLEVAVGEAPQDNGDNSNNPFVPQYYRGGGKGKY